MRLTARASGISETTIQSSNQVKSRKVFRVNVGCGSVPTPGWINYDNSISVRLAAIPLLAAIMRRLGGLSESQQHFIEIVRQQGIRYANAVRHIPLADGSVDALYTCHMLEHLDRREADSFLKEARRVLCPSGIIRVVVPDLRHQVTVYLSNNDADAFIENTCLTVNRPTGMLERVRRLIVGERNHLWMYDGESLCRLLLKAGFCNPQILKPGETLIPNPGELNLSERAEESVYVEAFR